MELKDKLLKLCQVENDNGVYALEVYEKEFNEISNFLTETKENLEFWIKMLSIDGSNTKGFVLNQMKEFLKKC